MIAASVYIDPASVIIGDVTIGEDSSVWPMCVIRGDVHQIRIGARTNIQDGSVLHVMRGEWSLVLGDEVLTPDCSRFWPAFNLGWPGISMSRGVK